MAGLLLGVRIARVHPVLDGSAAAAISTTPAAEAQSETASATPGEIPLGALLSAVASMQPEPGSTPPRWGRSVAENAGNRLAAGAQGYSLLRPLMAATL